MTPETIAIASIDASDRLRPVDPLKAEAISWAIEEKGLIQPVVVRADPAGAGYRLVAGAHRLAALVLLGRTELRVGAEIEILAFKSSPNIFIKNNFTNQ